MHPGNLSIIVLSSADLLEIQMCPGQKLGEGKEGREKGGEGCMVYNFLASSLASNESSMLDCIRFSHLN